MKRQSFCTTNLTKMKPKPLFLDLCQSKKRKKGYNLEVLTVDGGGLTGRQEDMFFRQENMKTCLFYQFLILNSDSGCRPIRYLHF